MSTATDKAKTAGDQAWLDLTVPDAAPIRDFYAAVCGWTPKPLAMDGYDDYMMQNAEGTSVAGVCHARGPNAGLPPMWLPYIVVPSLKAAIAEAERLGGRVIDHRDLGAQSLAIIRDPAGAHIGLMQGGEEGVGEKGGDDER
ncbi:MAG: VOC family protein [Pseudomonadota bacterium]